MQQQQQPQQQRCHCRRRHPLRSRSTPRGPFQTFTFVLPLVLVLVVALPLLVPLQGQDVVGFGQALDQAPGQLKTPQQAPSGGSDMHETWLGSRTAGAGAAEGRQSGQQRGSSPRRIDMQNVGQRGLQGRPQEEGSRVEEQEAEEGEHEEEGEGDALAPRQRALAAADVHKDGIPDLFGAFGPAEGANFVEELTRDNLEQGLSDPAYAGDIWLLNFYAPWCGHCKHFKSTWIEVGKKFSNGGSVRVGAVNCVRNRDFCGDMGIKGFPGLLASTPFQRRTAKGEEGDEDGGGGGGAFNHDFDIRKHMDKLFEPMGHGSSASFFIDWVDDALAKEGETREERRDGGAGGMAVEGGPTSAAGGGGDGNGEVGGGGGDADGNDTGKGKSKGKDGRASGHEGGGGGSSRFPSCDLRLVDATSSLRFALAKNVFVSNTKPLAQDTYDALLTLTSVAAHLLPQGAGAAGPAFQQLATAVKEDAALRDGPAFESYLKAWEARHFEQGVVWPAKALEEGPSFDGEAFSSGLWEMFHIMSVSQSPHRPSPHTVMHTIRVLVDHFFGCQVCRTHFLTMYDFCDNGRCLIKPTDECYRDLALWVWRAHNKVNQRLASEHQHVHDSELYLHSVPQPAQCPSCWVGPTGVGGDPPHTSYGQPVWDEDAVYEWLQQEYWCDAWGERLVGHGGLRGGAAAAGPGETAKRAAAAAQSALAKDIAWVRGEGPKPLQLVVQQQQQQQQQEGDGAQRQEDQGWLAKEMKHVSLWGGAILLLLMAVSARFLLPLLLKVRQEMKRQSAVGRAKKYGDYSSYDHTQRTPPLMSPYVQPIAVVPASNSNGSCEGGSSGNGWVTRRSGATSGNSEGSHQAFDGGGGGGGGGGDGEERGSRAASMISAFFGSGGGGGGGGGKGKGMAVDAGSAGGAGGGGVSDTARDEECCSGAPRGGEKDNRQGSLEEREEEGSLRNNTMNGGGEGRGGDGSGWGEAEADRSRRRSRSSSPVTRLRLPSLPSLSFPPNDI